MMRSDAVAQTCWLRRLTSNDKTLPPNDFDVAVSAAGEWAPIEETERHREFRAFCASMSVKWPQRAEAVSRRSASKAFTTFTQFELLLTHKLPHAAMSLEVEIANEKSKGNTKQMTGKPAHGHTLDRGMRSFS